MSSMIRSVFPTVLASSLMLGCGGRGGGPGPGEPATPVPAGAAAVPSPGPDRGPETPLQHAGPRSIWVGVYTEEQAERGAGVYSRSCATCHGRELRGGESAPSLQGDGFLLSWYGKPLRELSELIRATMPQTNPGGLSSSAYADVLAYILRENGFPAGQETLSQDPAALLEIMIERKKG